MRIKNANLLENTTEDLSADFTSKAVYLGHVGVYSIQAIFTGTPDGTFKLQCSNDEGHPEAVTEEMQSRDVVNWTDVTGSTITITTDGDLVYNVENVGYTWVRLVWTFNASTGTLTSARFNTKGF